MTEDVLYCELGHMVLDIHKFPFPPPFISILTEHCITTCL